MSEYQATYSAVAFAIIGGLVMLVLWEIQALIEDISAPRGKKTRPYFTYATVGVWLATSLVCLYILLLEPIIFQVETAVPTLEFAR